MVAHNGKLTQINPWFPNLSKSYPYLNIVKDIAQWASIINPSTTHYDPTKHDADGWMHTVYEGGKTGVAYIPGITDRPGNYICDWEGAGRIYCPWVNVLTGSKTTAGATGTFTCELGATAIAAKQISIGVDQVSVAGSVYPKNIRFYHEDDAALVLAGGMYATRYKALMAEFGVIRFLDVQGGNSSTVVNWADRMPLTHYSYAADVFPLAKYAGVTTNLGDDYLAVLLGFSLTDKAQIIVKFNADSSGTAPTINVQGTGAVPIKNPYGGTLSASQKPKTDYLGCLTYEDRLGCFLKLGGDTALGDRGISTGSPPEAMIRLCREVGADPWFVPPYLTVDPPSDYMTGLAQLCEDTLNA